MPHITQETKKEIHEQIKPILKKYNVKATMGIRHNMTLVLNISKSPIDFLGNYNRVAAGNTQFSNIPFTPEEKNLQVNEFHYENHFDGAALDFLKEIIPVLNGQNYTLVVDGDYGAIPKYYLDVNIGRWDKPYQLINE